MKKQEAINEIRKRECIECIGNEIGCESCSYNVAIKAMEEIQQYLEIGTIEEIKEHLAELERWHTDHVNKNIKNPFAWKSTLVCHNCDHKDDYIEELEAEIEDYHEIGTTEECREAVEKQKEMKAYCDENDCVGCPYHNVQLKENRCMNDFIAYEIMKGG